MTRATISVENLSKVYLVGHRAGRGQGHGYVALRDSIGRELRNAARKAVDILRGRQIVQGDEVEEFWALKDVSFEVKEGEVLGIIGRNGAGKSTLLKILSRITEPTAGRITLRGRVSSLLEVGTGFHPELSGRENIYLNGAILGMSRAEIRRKFDEIVAFAEIEKFLDTPVKRYSSGMYVRLAFAVAAHLEPEILIVDEVLAVGDSEFQKKCLGKMDDISRRDGRTILFVSHNIAAVNALTTTALLLVNGRIAGSGPPNEVIPLYLRSSDQNSDRLGKSRGGSIIVNEMTISGIPTRQVSLPAGPNQLNIIVRGVSAISSRLSLEAKLVTMEGLIAASFCPGHFVPIVDRVTEGPFEVTARIELPEMTTGRYQLNMSLTDPSRAGFWDYDPGLAIDVTGARPSSAAGDISKATGHGVFILPGRVQVRSIK